MFAWSGKYEALTNREQRPSKRHTNLRWTERVEPHPGYS